LFAFQINEKPTDFDYENSVYREVEQNSIGFQTLETWDHIRYILKDLLLLEHGKICTNL